MSPVIAGLAGRLHPGQDHVRDAVREHLPARSVTYPASPQPVDQRGELMSRDAPASRAAGQHDRLGGLGPLLPPGATLYLGLPRPALDPRHAPMPLGPD